MNWRTPIRNRCSCRWGCPAWAVLFATLLSGALAQGTHAGVTGADAGRELARLVQMDLVLRENPGPDDYLLAAHALSIASDQRPDDAELARLVTAAAWAGGDRDLLHDATRRVIRSDPADTVAQLRLLSANINAKQTAEERLASYDRVLGPAGEALDDSVRSRLALDAALLERELGRTGRFESRLRDAVRLDITNKDAVSLAARTFIGPDTGVEELIEWQIRLLYADPFDPHVHITIARVCAGQGALDSAQRFLENGSRLFEVSGQEVSPLLRSQRLALQWQQIGPRGVLESLNGPLYDLREQSAEAIQARIDAGEPHDDIRPPVEIRYDLTVERIRLLAAKTLGDDEAMNESIRDLTLTTEQSVRDLADAMSMPGANQQAILNELVTMFVNLQVSRGMVGRDIELIQAEIDSFNKSIPNVSRQTEHAALWLLFASGEYERAIREAGPYNAGSPKSLMVAMASEELGDDDTAAEIYQVFALTRALDAYGAFARSRLIAMGREQDIIRDAGRYLDGRLSRVPAWMDRIIGSPRSFMLLQAETERGTTGVTEPARVRVRLRNTASIPLGVGASRPVGSRMLMLPRSLSGVDDFAGRPTPRVLDLDRRLRLEPLGQIDVTLPADSPYSLWLRMVNAHTSQRDRYRVIQSFQPAMIGGLGPGPFGLVAETGIVQQTALGLARADDDQLIAAVESGDPETLHRAAIATLSRFYQTEGDLALDRDTQDRLVSAWTERFASLTNAERLLVLMILPHGLQSAAFEPFDRAVVETVVAESIQTGVADPSLMAGILMSRVRDPESPAFDVARADKDDHLRALGALLKSRIGSMQPAWSMIGSGVDAAGPKGLPSARGGFRP